MKMKSILHVIRKIFTVFFFVIIVTIIIIIIVIIIIVVVLIIITCFYLSSFLGGLYFPDWKKQICIFLVLHKNFELQTTTNYYFFFPKQYYFMKLKELLFSFFDLLSPSTIYTWTDNSPKVPRSKSWCWCYK